MTNISYSQVPDLVDAVGVSGKEYKVEVMLKVPTDQAQNSDRAPGIMTAGGMPLAALKNENVRNVFRQIIERRYDVRVLSEVYHLGDVPAKLTHNAQQYTVPEYADLMVQFLLNHIDEDPFIVAQRFQVEFPHMARPPELDQIFEKYMKIKMNAFDMQVLKDALPAGGIVADIGAGKNRLGQAILEFSDQKGLGIKRVIGTDLNDWPDRNKGVDGRLAFIVQNAGISLPLPSNSLDAVIVKWVLHHMPYEDQVAFLRSAWRVLKPGGRLIIFDSLGASYDQTDIIKDFHREILDPEVWPKGSFYNDNLKLTQDFLRLTSDQQLQIHALEDYFGHNLVMGRGAFMPQFFTYLAVPEMRKLMLGLGFNENVDLRRVYGSAPIMRMGPPSVRMAFTKNHDETLLVQGDGGENKDMFLINGLKDAERDALRKVLDVLVIRDGHFTQMLEDKTKVQDLVLIGNDRIDTFSEALSVINAGLANRIVVLGEFGKSTISLIERAVSLGFSVKVSSDRVINADNWIKFKDSITPQNQREMITISEGEIIKGILIQMVRKFPNVFENLQKRLSVDGDGFVVTVGDPLAQKVKRDSSLSDFIGLSGVDAQQVLFNYRRLLDKEEVFQKETPYKIMLVNTPIKQLRALAFLDSIFLSEKSSQNLQILSHTVSYDNISYTKSSAIKEALNEVWRLVIYSEYGRGQVNLRSSRLPKGIDSLTPEFWAGVSMLINALGRGERQELARELVQLAQSYNDISLDRIISAKKQNRKVSMFVNKIVKLSVIKKAPEDRAQLSSPELNASNARLLMPAMQYNPGRPLDVKPIRRLIKRNAEQVIELLLYAKTQGLTLKIAGNLRGLDGAGSSLDLPEFQEALTEQRSAGFDQMPSTMVIASDKRTAIRFELADDLNVIEYVAPDYGINENNPMRFTDDVKLTPDGRLPRGQVDAVGYVFRNIFGLKGIRIIMESISPIALAGGMESSNAFNVALLSAGSMLSGANLSFADIVALGVKLENDEFGGISGGQGHWSTILGGGQRLIWVSGVKDVQGRFVNNYGVVAQESFSDEQMRRIEEHTMLIQAGKEYKDGKAVVSRTARMVGMMWVDLLRFDSVGRELHRQKISLANQYAKALNEGDFKTIFEVLNRYVDIRDALTMRWVNLMMDAKIGRDVSATPYAKEFVRKVFEPSSPEESKDYQVISDLYNELEAKGNLEQLREVSLYSVDPISSLIKKSREAGIAIFPLGAGGLGSNMMAVSSMGLDYMRKFFEETGINEITDAIAAKIVNGTGILKGYMPFKIGREGVQINGFDSLPDVVQPALSQKTTVEATSVNIGSMVNYPDFFVETNNLVRKQLANNIDERGEDVIKGVETKNVVTYGVVLPGQTQVGIYQEEIPSEVAKQAQLIFVQNDVRIKRLPEATATGKEASQPKRLDENSPNIWAILPENNKKNSPNLSFLKFVGPSKHKWELVLNKYPLFSLERGAPYSKQPYSMVVVRSDARVVQSEMSNLDNIRDVIALNIEANASPSIQGEEPFRVAINGWYYADGEDAPKGGASQMQAHAHMYRFFHPIEKAPLKFQGKVEAVDISTIDDGLGTGLVLESLNKDFESLAKLTVKALGLVTSKGHSFNVIVSPVGKERVRVFIADRIKETPTGLFNVMWGGSPLGRIIHVDDLKNFYLMDQEQASIFERLDPEKRIAWKNTEFKEGCLKIDPDLARKSISALQMVTASQGEIDQIVAGLLEGNSIDRASVGEKGGIDFNSERMNLQNQGTEIKFNIDPAMVQQLQSASGLMPVIIGIHPMTTSVPMFLGLHDGVDKMAAVR